MQADHVLDEYERWLERQALAVRTCASYRRWVRALVAELDAGGDLERFLAIDGDDDRRAALGDWRRRLVDGGVAPSTVNLALAAATSLLDWRALPAPRVARVEVDPPGARALSREQLRAVANAVMPRAISSRLAPDQTPGWAASAVSDSSRSFSDVDLLADPPARIVQRRTWDRPLSINY